jgi:hypothetical protein
MTASSIIHPIFAVALFCVSGLYSVRAQAQSTNSPAASSAGALKSNQPIPEYIQEFFLSEAVRNQDQGEFQFTLGSDTRKSLGSNVNFDVEYGLTNRLQLSSESVYGVSSTAKSEISAGWSTISVGLNYQIIRNNSPLALTVGASFGLPVRSSAGLEIEPRLLAAKTFRRVQVHANLIPDVEKGHLSFQYNLASVWLVSSRWFPTLEFNGRRLDAQNGFYATPGLYRHLPHRLEIGLGTPVGIAGVAGRIGIAAKVTWEFGGNEVDGAGAMSP